jgi:hypothetical protein
VLLITNEGIEEVVSLGFALFPGALGRTSPLADWIAARCVSGSGFVPAPRSSS